MAQKPLGETRTVVEAIREVEPGIVEVNVGNKFLVRQSKAMVEQLGLTVGGPVRAIWREHGCDLRPMKPRPPRHELVFLFEPTVGKLRPAIPPTEAQRRAEISTR